MNDFRLKGLVAAPVTPMTADGEVDYSLIETSADLLKANDVSGAFVCGTTGESLSLSVAERKRITEQWKKSIGE